MKQNKYRYLYVLQGWYVPSWSNLVEYDKAYADQVQRSKTRFKMLS